MFIKISKQDNLENKYLITKYSIGHFLLGIIWRIFSKNEKLFLFLHSLFEIIENTPFGLEFFQRNTVWTEYTGDSLGNSIFDIIFGQLGFYIADLILNYFDM